MSRTFTAICALLMLAAALNIAAAPCPDRVGHWPYGPTRGVAALGSTVYFGAGTVLRVTDVADPENPVILSELTLDRLVHGMALANTTLFVGVSERGLVAVNVADPAHPAVLGEIGDIGRTHRLWLDGGIAYVATATGLAVVDISSPASMELVAFVDDELNYVYGLWKADDLLYVASTREGLSIFNVADPAAPVLLGMLELDSARGVAVSGSYAYVADHFDGLRVVNVANPAEPILTATLELDNAYMYQCLVVGNYLYVAHRHRGVAVLELSDPSMPADVGRVMNNGEAYDMVIDQDRIFVADHYRGLTIADITTPEESVYLGDIEGFSPPRELSAAGNLAAATAVGDVYLFDISDPSDPTRIATVDPSRWVDDVVLVDDLAFLALDRFGLQIVDLSSPASPVELGQLDVGFARFLAVEGDRAVLVDDDGLVVIDVSDPEAPAELGRMEVDFSPSGLFVTGNAAYLSDYQTGIHVVDLSSPAAPVEVNLVEMDGASHPAAASGDLFFMGQQGEGLKILDISDPLDPVEIGAYHDTTYFSGITAAGDLVAVASLYSGFHVVDVSDPANPTAVGVSEMAMTSECDAAAVGNLVIVAEDEAGIELFDITDCVAQPMAAGFSVDPAIPIAGHAAELVNTSTGYVSAWSWDFGDGDTSSERNPIHAWSAPGTYLVTLSISGTGESDSTSRVVTVTGGN